MAIPTEEKNGIWAEIERKSPDLIKAFLSLKNEAELKAFFRDLMSERDLREFAMRWEVAKKLDAGLPFSQIQKESGESPTTPLKPCAVHWNSVKLTFPILMTTNSLNVPATTSSANSAKDLTAEDVTFWKPKSVSRIYTIQ